jgi:hypothetical protein
MKTTELTEEEMMELAERIRNVGPITLDYEPKEEIDWSHGCPTREQMQELRVFFQNLIKENKIDEYIMQTEGGSPVQVRNYEHLDLSKYKIQ